MIYIVSFLLLLLLNFYFNIYSCKVYHGFTDVTQMPLKLSDMTATLITNSMLGIHNLNEEPKVYIIGGCSKDQLCPINEYCYCPEVSNSCNIFYIKTQTWKNCSLAPRGRCRHSATVLNGKIYLLGGRDVNDNLITEIDVYDIIKDKWLETPIIWKNASSDSGAFSYDNSIYVIGGYDSNYAPLSTLTKYTPDTNIWNYNLPSMAYARGDLGAISVPKNNKDINAGSNIFVVGGFAYSICKPLSVVETFDPSINTWTTRSSLNSSRADMALGLIQGLLFTIAGETKDKTCDDATYAPGISIPVNYVERLESIDGDWVYEEDIPDERFRFIAASYDDAIYLFGGQGTLKTPIGQTPYYPVLNTTILYVPKSISDRKELDDGEIAGIVIGVVAFVFLVVIAGISYLIYRKYHGYSQQTDEDAKDPNQSKNIEGVEVSVTANTNTNQV